MADLKLKDGTEITFDLESFTYDEYWDIFEKDDRAYTMEIIARSAGIPVEKMKVYGFETYRRVQDVFFKKCREPLADPNLPSAPG